MAGVIGKGLMTSLLGGVGAIVGFVAGVIGGIVGLILAVPVTVISLDLVRRVKSARCVQ